MTAIMRPQLTPEEIHQYVLMHDVTPFQEMLGKYIQGQPSVEDIREFARKNPAMYAQACHMVAGLAGYKKEQVHTTNVLVLNIHKLSDMELVKELERLEGNANELRALPSPQGAIDTIALAHKGHTHDADKSNT